MTSTTTTATTRLVLASFLLVASLTSIVHAFSVTPMLRSVPHRFTHCDSKILDSARNNQGPTTTTTTTTTTASPTTSNSKSGENDNVVAPTMECFLVTDQAIVGDNDPPMVVCTTNPEEYAWYHGIDPTRLQKTTTTPLTAMECVEGASPRGIPEWECK